MYGEFAVETVTVPCPPLNIKTAVAGPVARIWSPTLRERRGKASFQSVSVVPFTRTSPCPALISVKIATGSPLWGVALCADTKTPRTTKTIHHRPPIVTSL